MKTVIPALINSPIVRSLGQLAVYLCAAAVLIFFVLQQREATRMLHERNLIQAEIREAVREARSQREAMQRQVDEQAYAIWGVLEPRVEKQEQKASTVAPRVPAWQGWQQELTNRVQRLEEWRLRHMSQEH